MSKSLFPVNPILMVDDEENIIIGWGNALKSRKINNLIPCSDSRKVTDILGKTRIEHTG
jgi:hypothetical protein